MVSSRLDDQAWTLGLVQTQIYQGKRRKPSLKMCLKFLKSCKFVSTQLYI